MSHEKIDLVFDGDGERLDKWLAQALPDYSRTQIKALINDGRVETTGQLLKPNTILKNGTPIIVRPPAIKPTTLKGQNIPIDILYEDDYILVINKPAGLVVHPSAGHTRDTLVNALLYKYPDMATLDPERPGIVHRLDMDTSGVIVVARSNDALNSLQQQFKDRTVHKVYLALVHGRPSTPTGVIDAPIRRHPQHRQRMAAMTSGKPARTRFSILKATDSYSLLELILETGRTHQIRVHMAWLGFPVVGDNTYGRRKSKHTSRQVLHAAKLEIDHPVSSQRMTFEAPLPSDFSEILTTLMGLKVQDVI